MNYKDLEQKLLAMGHTQKTADAIVSAMVSMDKYGLSDDEKHAAYSLLSDVGFEALRELPDAVAKGEWREFDLGNVTKGDYVRVKNDAYTSEDGVKHNGKVGRLADMYGGRCLIHYIGLDTGDAMRHPVRLVESLKKV
jgi:restriction endonuclease Mrr